MSFPIAPAQQAIQNARQALREGNRRAARRWAQIAVAQSPELEDSWLILAAVSSPQDSLAHLKRALQINPSSRRARQGMRWAIRRIRAEANLVAARQPPIAETPPQEVQPRSYLRSQEIAVMVAVLLAVFLMAAGLAAWKGYPQVRSVLSANKPGIVAAAVISTPAPNEVAGSGEATDAASPTPMQPVEPTPTFTNTPLPTDTPTPTATFTPLPTDTPTQPPPTQAPSEPLAKPPVAAPHGERWIDVDLSRQRVYAYEGDQLIQSFLISSGTRATPTVLGTFRIYVKYRSQTMSGVGYYLPNVPYVMYFYKGYSLHGTYWHNNFGTPMSHGCLNMRTEEAAWLYKWASVGTLVNVHR